MPHTPIARARQYARTRQRRNAWIRAHGPCPCGRTENLVVRPKPGVVVPKGLWTCQPSRRDAALEHCDVLCKRCRPSRPVAPHGRRGYVRGCRCAICRAAHAAIAKRYREKRKLDRFE